MIGSGLEGVTAAGGGLAWIVAATGDEGLVERWRDLGPVLWLVAAGAGALWAALLAALAFATRSREVDPGPSTLGLGGPEPPAVVNLLTGDWSLGHEAVPATLLDLAARRLVAIDQVGERTLVRVRRPPDGERQPAAELEPYERMVLDHAAGQATDGVVPAEALTTGPEDQARGWWRSFRRSVEEAASRWLRLRTLLAEDPLFAEHPPAGVAIWDRLLAYGAAMGVAHGAVRALPLGAERDDEAWSSVGGHWRVVRVRYPRFVPPGYGRHPALVAFLGLFQLGLAVLALPAATAAADGLRDFVVDFSADNTVPTGFEVGVSVGLGVVVALAALLALRGAGMALAGIVDLVSKRRTVEGRVLRLRRRGTDDNPRWYLGVDEGEAGTIRAWRTPSGGAVQGSTVRAQVTRWLAHVRNLEVVAEAPDRPSLPDDGDDAEASPLSALLGTVATSASADGPRASLPAATGPPPPLPDAAAVSAAAGRTFEVDAAVNQHLLAAAGRSAAFTGADGATIQVAWVDPALLQAHRSMPRLLRRELRPRRRGLPGRDRRRGGPPRRPRADGDGPHARHERQGPGPGVRSRRSRHARHVGRYVTSTAGDRGGTRSRRHRPTTADHHRGPRGTSRGARPAADRWRRGRRSAGRSARRGRRARP